MGWGFVCSCPVDHPGCSSQGQGAIGGHHNHFKGALMKQFLLVTASSLALVSAAAAADLPTRQPPPPTPVVGKAPIGKAPIGKAPTVVTKG